MHQVFGAVDVEIAAGTRAFEAWISQMYARCDLLIGNWLQNRECSSLPAKIATRILDTVRTLFLNPAYSEISLKQIAEMAKVTEGAIYRLFGSRVGLNECVQRDTLMKITAFTRRLVADRGASGITLQDIALGVGLREEDLRLLFASMDELLKYILRPKDN